jgi:hypothetical protein
LATDIQREMLIHFRCSQTFEILDIWLIGSLYLLDHGVSTNTQSQSGSNFYIICSICSVYVSFGLTKFRQRYELIHMMNFEIVCMAYSDFLSAAYHPATPIGGCLCKKQLGLFFPFSGIISKRDLKSWRENTFYHIITLLTTNEKAILWFMGQKKRINWEQLSAKPRR